MNKIKNTNSDIFYDRIAKLLTEARNSVVKTINKTAGGMKCSGVRSSIFIPRYKP